MDLATANSLAGSITQELGKVLVGQQAVIEEAVVALLAGGHALLEGVPGTGKTLLGRALARVTGTRFRRISSRRT
jgi:MoxR-like ATPase